jgi:glycosyltransferase involved in cell wall biosynthesis
MVKTKKNPHIIIATYVVPFPSAAGNEIRILKMLRWLKSCNYRVTLILKPCENIEVPNECIAGLCSVVDELFVYDTRFKGTNNKHFDLQFDRAEARPHLADLQERFCPAWFVGEVNGLVHRLRPDVIIAEYIFISRILLLDSLSSILKIIDLHDLFSANRDNFLKFERDHNVKNMIYTLSDDDEALLLQRADAVLAIQLAELNAINRLALKCKGVLVSYDVDLCYPDLTKQQPGVILIVASSNEFNIRGTQNFLDSVWPLVRQRCSNARLHIVGKVCDHIRINCESVKKLGYVNNLTHEYERANVVVNPCFIGSGLKIKTIEALSWGKAHVGWPVSGDGLRELAPLPYPVATNEVEFADCVVELLLDQNRAASIGHAAHEFANRHFGAGTTYASLAELITAHIAEHK